MMGVGLGVSRVLHGRYQAQAPAPCQSKGGTHSRPLGLHVHHPLPDPYLTITITITVINTCELCCQVETCCRIMFPHRSTMTSDHRFVHLRP
jgi:hypothetical protein